MTDEEKQAVLNALRESGWEKVVYCKNCRLQRFCKVTEHLGEDGYCNYGEE